MMRTLFFGGGSRETSTLPARVAMPAKVFTSPSASSLPPFRESTMAGRAASKQEAIRLTKARNRISFRISACSFSHFRPEAAC